MKKEFLFLICLSIGSLTALAQEASLASGFGVNSPSSAFSEMKQVTGNALVFPSSLGDGKLNFPGISHFTGKSGGNFSLAAAAGGEGCFSRGSFAISLGIGVGNFYWGTGYGTGLPVAPTLTMDYAITDKIGIGNIAVGGTVSYSSTKYNTGYNSYTYSGVLVGLRGSYHFVIPSDIGAKLDPYAGILLGYIITNNPNIDGAIYNGKASAFQPGIFAGAHYFFMEHFGAYAELGYNGFSILNIGITIKI